MEASTQPEPGLWAEQMQLILPSSEDGKPETGHQGPLRECAPLIADALRHCSLQQRCCFAFVVTEASKVGVFVALLRKSTQQLLVGSLCENEWLVPALDVIVASPEQAIEYGKRGWMSSDTLKALLIDRSCSSNIFDQALKFAARFSGFDRSLLELPCHRRPWFYRPRLVSPSQAILKIISGSSETWDPIAYVGGLSTFAWGVSKVAVQEFVDVPVLLPGIIRGSLARASPPLVLAPREKLDQIAKLLQTTAAELGLPDLSVGRRNSDVLLDSPEELVMPQYPERLVIIEADTLLETGSAWKIKRLAGICLNCPIGLQFSRRTEAVEELLKGSKEPFYVVRRPGLTLNQAFQFYSPVNDEAEKVARVCSIWSQLKKLYLAVFCNSSSTVVRVAEEMRRRGVPTWPLCEGDDEEEVYSKMEEDAFPLLVTNIYRRTSRGEVINFELPGSVEEYVERVGHDRSTGGRRKLVINILTAEEHQKLAPGFPPMLKLPENCSRIYGEIPLLFPDIDA